MALGSESESPTISSTTSHTALPGAQMLNLDLARRTESFFVDWLNQLLTVAVPTDFPLKKPWTSQGNCKYAFYHKTDWANVPKILSEQLVRPLIGPETTKEYPNNSPLMGLLEWRVKSTLSTLP